MYVKENAPRFTTGGIKQQAYGKIVLNRGH